MDTLNLKEYCSRQTIRISMCSTIVIVMASMPYSRIIDRATKGITNSYRNKHIEYPCGCRYLFDHHIILDRICSEPENELIAHHG